MLSFTLRDLLRNPRRTLASVTGVALAVGLFSGIVFFVDSSAATMTQRAVAPVAIDMQAGVTSPLASPLALTEAVTGPASLAVGQTATVTLTLVNTGNQPATALLFKDAPPTPLTYMPGSTTLNGKPVSDVARVNPDDGTVSVASPLIGGLKAGDLAPRGTSTVTYQARASAAVASLPALALQGSVSSREELAPVAANSAAALNLSDLASQIALLPGVSGVDPLGSLDLAPGSLKAGTLAVNQPLRVFAFDPAYPTHYPMVRITAGSYSLGSVLLSPDAAKALGVGPGGAISLSVPGRLQPIPLKVGGVADFSRADALFASRSGDNQGEFVQVPNVVVVGMDLFANTILPALRVDAASPSPLLKTSPALELDVSVNRSRLASDPSTASVFTQGLKRSIERAAPGQVAVIDNLSDAINAAKGDAILAKILFLFLGLPGVLLAAYLSRYAGGLLAQAQRRERATLRTRGAQPAQLIRALTYNTIFVAVLGSLLGLGLGLGAVFLIFGGASLASAAPSSFMLSALLSVAAGLITTGLALYLPGLRSLRREAGEERREMEAAPAAPAWLRLRLDLAFLAAAAIVGAITYLSGGFKPTPAEGQSVSLSFYTLLAPLLGWVGATLLAVRLILFVAARAPDRRTGRFGGLTAGTLGRSLKRRSSSIASGIIAISLAVAFGSSLAIFVATYQAEKQADARFVVGSDLRVTASALSPQPAGFASQLQVPGVSAVTAVAQTSNALVGTDKRALVAIDAANFQSVASMPDSFFAGTTASRAMAALRSDPAGLLVSAELARTFNVQTGDLVKVQLADRSGKLVPVTFHAVGVFKSFSGFPQGVDLVANLAFYQSATGSSSVDFFLLRAADPSQASVERAAALLRAGPGQRTPLLVDTTASAINKDQSTLAALNLRGLGSLESVYTVLISAAGIAIFVFGLLLQRRKEYVTMRALGIRFGQLRSLVLGEAGLVAVLSLVVGGLVGTAMAYMFVQILGSLFTIPPASLTFPAQQLAVLAVMVLAGMGLSGLLAARSLGRLSPVELLREE
ncbi:MAG TPA: FtsX-like permease family protein [Candidatus Dormibacteraeota bacterium]|nr:FtsX-like permease family protein [Candidatus Dormibacteraeota bacterium]